MKATINEEKLFSKKWFISYSLIVIGTFIMAAGYVLFINPYNIVPGGVYGIGIVLHHLIPDVPIGIWGLLLDIPLTLIGMKILGPKFGVKTVVGMILISAFMTSLTFLIGDDPKTMLNGTINLTNDILLSCIFAGVVIGFGLGLVFKSRATSGGSDIVASILAKYTKQPMGKLLIYVDSAIVLIGFVVFEDWKIPMYSWIVIFICGKVIDIVIKGLSYEKTLFIISDKYEEIREKLLVDIERGGTVIHAQGMYNNSDKKIIFTNVNVKELAVLQEFIHEIDPQAFLTVIEANDVFGNGFKSLKDKI